MADVAVLFHAERWVSEWRAIGGTVYLAESALATASGCDGLLEMGPTFSLAEPGDSPRRRQVEHLRKALAMPGARDAVRDHMIKRHATIGLPFPSETR